MFSENYSLKFKLFIFLLVNAIFNAKFNSNITAAQNNNVANWNNCVWPFLGMLEKLKYLILATNAIGQNDKINALYKRGN